MPLTPLQKDVLAVLAANRSEASHFAGGLVLHALPESSRYSHDFDIFHEVAEEVTQASQRDVADLRASGFQVETLDRDGEWGREASFRKARITRGDESFEIDWAADSAFRYFPIERDAVMGWRLHWFDVATNKALALSARTETRDYIDILELSRLFPLPAICWAACGKDPGFTPISLLKMMRRFARLDPARMEEIQARRLDAREMKTEWIRISDEAEAKMIRVADEQPDLPIGVAFVDATGRPGWIGDDPTLKIHAPSLRGCWPRVHLPGE